LQNTSVDKLIRAIDSAVPCDGGCGRNVTGLENYYAFHMDRRKWCIPCGMRYLRKNFPGYNDPAWTRPTPRGGGT
jgi:hypothetical protein